MKSNLNRINSENSVDSVNIVNSVLYSAVLPPSLMVFFLLNVSMDFRIFPVADLQKGSLLLVQVEGSLINSDLYD